MKKTIFILVICLIFLAAGCTSIDSNLTGKRIKTDPSKTYTRAHTPYRDSSSYYYPDYFDYNPFFPFYSPFGFGMSWMNPWYYYGLYDYFSWYYPRNSYGWGYGYGYSSGRRNGRSSVTKRSLQKLKKRRIPTRGTVSRRGLTRTRSSGGVRGTVSRSGSSRGRSSGSSRGTVSRSGSSRGRSSGSSRGTVSKSSSTRSSSRSSSSKSSSRATVSKSSSTRSSSGTSSSSSSRSSSSKSSSGSRKKK